MKKIIYSMLVLLIIGITGCVQEDIVQLNSPKAQGGEIAVQFSVTIPEYQTVLTRANGGVNDLTLLVFDENGKFIYMRTATLSGQTENGGTFTVMMQPTANKRVVHFISNYEFADDFYDNALGKSEQEVVNALQSDKLLLWNRTELEAGISDTPNLGQFNNGVTVTLLRNQAKISVVNEESNSKLILTGFALYKAPDKGTAAPFDMTTKNFAIGVITPVADATLSGAPTDDDFTMDEKYLFERLHQNSSDYTAIIIKGTYNGEPCYYKIDLLNKPPQPTSPPTRYDIERNYHYKLVINKVNMMGVTELSNAINGAPSNNVALDALLDKFPVISDGKEKMKIDKTTVIFTEANADLAVKVNYWPDVTTDPDHVDNSNIKLYVEGETSIFSTPPSVDASGLIAATICDPLPTDFTEATIVVTKGSLSRKLRVIVAPPFELEPTINGENPAILGSSQDTEANLSFTIPNELPNELFPFDVKIKTQTLYAAQSGLQMHVENGEIYYIYNVTTPGTKNIAFKTNNANTEETITLSAEGFTDASVFYNSNTFTFSGTIQWYYRRWHDVPFNGNVIQTAGPGTFEMTSDGYYKIVIPEDTPDATNITIVYSQGGSWADRKETKTVGQLKTNPEWRLEK